MYQNVVAYPWLRVGKKKEGRSKKRAEELRSGIVGEKQSAQPPGGLCTMSIQFAQGKLKGQERKAVIQEIQQQLQEAALAVISSLLTHFLEEELTAKLGREKGEPRRVSLQPREIDWQCGHC